MYERRDEVVTKKSEIYLAVRHDIMSGKIAPQQIIKEGDLARQYGVSKSPVREALIILTFERWLRPVPRVGYMVNPVTVTDVIEFFHLRQLLEVEAARLAAERLTPGEIQALEQIAGIDAEAQEHRTNHDFHTAIARASGSSLLADLIIRLLDDLERILILDPGYGSVPSGQREEHLQIVEALRRQDAPTAQGVLAKHLDGARRRIVERFQGARAL